MGALVVQGSRRASRRARRRLDASPLGTVLAVRTAPPLDPPFEGASQPPGGMELLPVEWATVASVTREVAEPERPSPVQRPSPPPKVTARAALQRYVGMCVEVLNGYRPATHLRAATDPQRYGDVADQLVRRTVRVRMPPGQAARHGRLVRVRRLLACEPLDGIVEATVVLEQGEACWAMAVRMERNVDDSAEAQPGGFTFARRSGPWRCVLVEVV
jgi:hypothetical protein